MPVTDRLVDQTTPMGATLHPDGATLRTWAPNARAVYAVAGNSLQRMRSDSDWRPAIPDRLRTLGDGTWAGFVPGLAEGDEYMFWLDGQGSQGPKRDPYARELSLQPPFPKSGCVVRDPATFPWQAEDWTPPAFRDLIIYQLHTGTWWAVDEAGRDARATRPATFLDAAARLPYLRDLGINAIQLLPVQEFPTQFSLGYNGVDYFSPENDYVLSAGGEFDRHLIQVNRLFASFDKPGLTAAQLQPGANQLKCLVDLAHLHGIAVILDLVYNHAGGGFDDASIWFFDRQPTGDRNHSLYFTDHGWAGGQVFAYWNDSVRRFLIDNADFFLREYRTDGIRYDEVRVIENEGGRALCQDMTDGVRATNPAAIQIAEYWNPDRPSAVAPPPGGLGFDAELGDGLRDALRGLLGQASGGEGAALDLGSVAAELHNRQGIPDAWRLVQCLENQDLTYAGHDGAARVPVLADGADRSSWFARSRSRAVTALLLTAPGIPMLFMGQEILEDKPWSDDRNNPGTFIWWDGLAQDRVRRDFLTFMTDLLHLRRAHPALRGDTIRVSHVSNFERVIVVHRWLDGEGADVVIVASLDEQPKHEYRVGLPEPGIWREVFNSDAYDYFPNPATVGNGGQVETEGGPLDGFEQSAWITIPANGAVVFVR